MTPRGAELVRLLADGAFHSGEALAAALGVTRAAVSKQAHALDAWGLDVESAPRRGYRLRAPVDLLDAEEIRARLAPATRARLRRLDVHDDVESTNTRLLAANDLPPGAFDACFAEFQSAGRGRRGRGWVAPYASGLCASFSWSFREAPAELSALSLAAGVAALRALAACGVEDVRLKWPNDLLRGDRKLGGILCELRAEAGGPAFVVIGIGLNVRLDERTRARIAESGGLEPAALTDDAAAPRRSVLAAHLLDALAAVAADFELQGFAPFHAEWSRADALAGRAVRVLAHRGDRDGRACGIDADGSLLVDFAGGRERVAAGEVSLRPSA